MNKKKLNTEQTLSELADSPFFREAHERQEKSGKAVSSKKRSASRETKKEPSKKRSTVATVEKTNERTKVRHTFDIFSDQLMSLKKIQLEREEMFGKRYRIGDLAQEALDMLISKERNND